MANERNPSRTSLGQNAARKTISDSGTAGKVFAPMQMDAGELDQGYGQDPSYSQWRQHQMEQFGSDDVGFPGRQPDEFGGAFEEWRKQQQIEGQAAATGSSPGAAGGLMAKPRSDASSSVG